MRKSFLRQLIFALTLSAITTAAQALTLPVICNGNQVGNITVNLVAGGVSGSFTSTVGNPASQGAAAAACNEDHFNWYQVVTADNQPPVDAAGNRLAAPYVDVPPGGYGNDPNTALDDTQWGDQLPWYWDEGADPPNGTPGFQNGYNVTDQTAGAVLGYSDLPGGVPNTNLSFSTWLVSLNADGSFHSWHPGFSWDWTNASGTGVSSNLMALGGDPTAAQYQNLIGGFQTAVVPLPAALYLLLSGLPLLLMRKRRQAGGVSIAE